MIILINGAESNWYQCGENNPDPYFSNHINNYYTWVKQFKLKCKTKVIQEDNNRIILFL